jgi:hypothetical protein
VAVAHPSLSETADYASLKKPGLFLRAADDFVFTDEKVAEAVAATEETAKEGVYSKVGVSLNSSDTV